MPLGVGFKGWEASGAAKSLTGVLRPMAANYCNQAITLKTPSMSVIGILQQLSPAKSSSAGMDDQNVEFLLSNIPKQVRLFFRH